MKNFLANSIFKQDFIETFTNSEYLSREDILSRLGSNFSEDTWTKTLEYRKLIIKKINLSKNINNQIFNYYYTNTPLLTKVISKTTTSLAKLFANVSILNHYEYHIKKGSTTISKPLKEKEWEILNNSLGLSSKKMPKEFNAYFSEENFQNIESFSTQTIQRWLNIVHANSVNFFRSKSYMDTNFYTMHIKWREIPVHFESLACYINESNDEPFLVKAIIAFSYIRLGILFGKEINDLVALFTLYYIIGKEFPLISEWFFLAELITTEFSSTFSNNLEKSMKNNYDMTFMLLSFLKIIDKYCEKMLSLTNLEINNLIKNDSISLRVNLQRNYPTMNQKEIHFFENIMELEKYYNIKNFIQEENTSYETARTSLQKLADLNLIEKIKIGKKFVYKKISN